MVSYRLAVAKVEPSSRREVVRQRPGSWVDVAASGGLHLRLSLQYNLRTHVVARAFCGFIGLRRDAKGFMDEVEPCDLPYLDARGTSRQELGPAIIRVSIHTWDVRVRMN